MGVGVLTKFFLVINVIHRGPTERTLLKKQFDPRGPIASHWVPVPEFLRKPTVTCNFPEEGGFWTPISPLDPLMTCFFERYSQKLPDIPFISAIFYMVTNGFEHPSGRCYMSCIKYLKLIG